MKRLLRKDLESRTGPRASETSRLQQFYRAGEPGNGQKRNKPALLQLRVLRLGFSQNGMSAFS